METTQPTPVVDNDEAALDKELADSIASVQAGKPLAPEPVAPVVPEVKTGATPPTPKEETPGTPPAPAPVNSEVIELRLPNKGKFESDESYEKRVELFDFVQRRKAATTPEQKAELSQKIQSTKGQLKTINGTEKIITPPNPAETTVPPQEEDEATKADRERLKALGGITKEDMETMLSERDATVNIKSTLTDFVKRHPELGDADVREVFFDFVDSNYNWNGKTGKDLMTVLELARENMFKPSESIQERVLKGANVQEKVNAMQFPGGTSVRTDHSPETKKALDELKATGLSEEVALELLKDE